MRILITGGGGQLAADLVLAMDDHDVRAPNREVLDITNAGHVIRDVESFQPHVVINTAAFHQVDRCEVDPESAFLTNAAAPQRLAAVCKRIGALLVHISTDYVFDGRKTTPYTEIDPVAPLSVYAASKVAGEMAVRATLNRHLIIRTSGLYGLQGRSSRHGNFVERMLALAEHKQAITVVDDQVLTPSSTDDVAAIIRGLIERDSTGTFHVTNSGQCSWYEFARTIFELAGVDADLRATTQANRHVAARRPDFSVLAHHALQSIGLPELRPWRDALNDYIQIRAES